MSKRCYWAIAKFFFSPDFLSGGLLFEALPESPSTRQQIWDILGNNFLPLAARGTQPDDLVRRQPDIARNNIRGLFVSEAHLLAA
jgi:hypothetical protein